MTHPRSAFGAPPRGGDTSGPAKPDPRCPLGGMLRRIVAVAALAATNAFAGPVQAPHYGDTLFQFYQEHYFSSVTGLMVS